MTGKMDQTVLRRGVSFLDIPRAADNFSCKPVMPMLSLSLARMRLDPHHLLVPHLELTP